MGVSATHIDWTMVPYVRKSFAKHFKDGLKYCCPNTKYNLESLPKELSFNDEEAQEPYNKIAYDYAMDMTKREVHQAAEAFIHNLNILGRLNSNIKNIAI